MPPSPPRQTHTHTHTHTHSRTRKQVLEVPPAEEVRRVSAVIAARACPRLLQHLRQLNQSVAMALTPWADTELTTGVATQELSANQSRSCAHGLLSPIVVEEPK